MRDIVIFGASGFGAQIVFLIECINQVNAQWNILGYTDDDPRKHGTVRYKRHVLGGKEWLQQRTEEIHIALGIGYPQVKAAVVESLSGCPAVRFPSLIHPSAIVCPSTRLGSGTMLCENVVIKTDVNVGEFVTINTGSVIGHDSIIRDGVSLMPTVNISGDVTICEGAFIGSNATVLQGLTVGKNAVVGAGAVVTKNVPPNCTVCGIPAKVVRQPNLVKEPNCDNGQ